MKKLIVLFFIIIFGGKTHSQISLNWVKTFSVSNSNSAISAKNVQFTQNGDVVVCGYFSGTTDFDPSINNYFLTPEVNRSLFIAKYTNVGGFLWVKELPILSQIQSDAFICDMILDNNDNIYVTGLYSGSFDLDPSLAVYNFSTNSTYNTMFTAKYNSSGNLVWAKNNYRTYNTAGRRIALDNLNNVYVGGAVGCVPYFCKFNNNGILLWKDSLVNNAPGSSNLSGFYVNGSGEVFVSGDSYDIDMDPSSGTFSLQGGTVYIGKYNTNGGLIWAKKLLASNPTEITVDNQGNLYTLGFPNFNSLEMTKWNSNGNLQWYNTINNGPGGGLQPGLDRTFHLSINCGGNIMLACYAGNNVNLDPFGNYTIPNDNQFGGGLVLASYSTSNGGLLWAKPLAYGAGGFGNGIILCNSIFENGSVYINGNGNIVVFRNYGTVTDFDPSLVINSITPNNNPYGNIFIAKYTGCGAVGIEEYNALQKITVFPNPSSNVFTFSSLAGETSIEVYDVSGRLIKTGFCSEETYKLNLSGYNSGVYFYKIKDKHNGLQQGKLLLQ